MPPRVEQVQAAVEADARDHDRGVVAVAFDGPLLGAPWRVLPEVEAAPEPLEVLVAHLDVTGEQPADDVAAAAMEPDCLSR